MKCVEVDSYWGEAMGKYESLKTYLQNRGADEVPMSFAEIERIVGSKLPPSQQNRAWWSNNPSNNVMTKSWLAAGYRTERVDIEGRRLVFKRVRSSRPSRPPAASGPAPSPSERKRHPLFGALKGLLTVSPGTDLAQPADPHWAEEA